MTHDARHLDRQRCERMPSPWCHARARWTGRLEAERLADAARRVWERHGLAVLGNGGGGPVAPTRLRPPLGCRERPLAERGGALPLWLTEASAAEGWLRLAVPRARMDGPSVELLLGELSRAYSGTVPADEAQDLEGVLAWRRELLEDADSPGHAFWSSYRFPDPALPRLPGLRVLPGADDPVWLATLPVALDPGTASGLVATGRAAGAGLSEAVLSAFLAALWRLAERAPIVAGVVHDGRAFEELRSCVGPLARRLPLHVPLRAEMRFSDLVSQVAQTLAEQRDWLEFYTGQGLGAGAVPLPWGFEWLRAGEHASGDVVFALDRVQADVGDFVVQLACLERMEGLDCGLRYDAAALGGEDATSVAACFVALAGSAAADPETPLGRLDVLGRESHRRFVLDASATAIPIPERTYVHELIEEQARRRPDAIAVSSPGRDVSYDELLGSAQAVTSALVARGVGPDTLVGVLAERSPEMLAGVFGLLRAGAAYLPLDPRAPRERLAAVLRDAGVGLVLTQAGLEDRLPDEVARLRLEGLGRPPGAAAVAGARGDHLAYVIYTSGSTGAPKGVMVTHDALMASNAARLHYYGEPVGAFLLLSPLAFDSSVAGIFWTLTTGGRLVLVPSEAQRDPGRLARVVREHAVTHLLALPSLYELLLDAAEPGEMDSLRVAVVAGEPCPRRLVDRHRAKLPAARLFNEYGATETTVWSTVSDLLARELPYVPLGAPIPNARLYLLDPDRQPVAVGVPGEIYLGGPGLARGYLRQPEATAARFVEDPVGSEPGARLYRTGDLARRHWNGELEYLGRADRQVKIRGFRVEPEEVESVLAEHPGIRETSVVARSSSSADEERTSLWAYVVPLDPRAEAGEWREFLARRLPDYMVPARFVVMAELPRTATGKPDPSRLPVADEPAPASDGELPRTATERALAEIWLGLLGVSRVGRHDDFFALGGDSILSIQAAARARRMGYAVAADAVFQNPTLAALAATVRPVAEAPVAAPRRTGPVPLTPIQRWFLDPDPPQPHHANMSLLFELRRPVEPVRLAGVLQSVAAGHSALRLRFRRRGGAWEQRLIEAADRVAALDVHDLAAAPPEALDSIAEERAAAVQAGLDIANGPLLRAALFDLGPSRPARLVLAVHHLACDGVSLRVLAEDLEEGLEQAERGEPVRLPDEVVGFAQWASRLADEMDSVATREELPYWQAMPREPRALPRDLPGPADAPHRSARTVSRHLDAASTRVLLAALPSRLGVRVDAAMLAALLEALSAWTGRRSQVVAFEGHGRLDLGLDVTRTVGWFTAAYPLALELGEEAGAPAVRRVHARLSAVPRGGAGFGLLRDALDPGPDPELLFAYLGRFDTLLADSRWLRLADGHRGPEYAPDSPRRHVLEVGAWVGAERLHVELVYSDQLHRATTIERLADDFVDRLEDLVRLVAAPARRAPRVPGADAPEVEASYPLTKMQEGMLYECRHRGGAAYFQQQVLSFVGAFDVVAFEEAWADVVARHEVMRTRFGWRDEEAPVQEVVRGARARIERHDVSEHPDAERQRRLGALVEAERVRPVSVDEAPLLRLVLVRTAPDRHELIVSFHHLLLDGWSLFIVLGELFRCYEARRSGAPAALPDPPRPFREFVDWEHERAPAVDERYWRPKLAGFRQATPLLGDRGPDPDAGPIPLTDSRQVELREDDTDALQRLCRRERLTLNTLVAGAWALLLARCAGESDVLFGAIVSTRPPELPGSDAMVGPLINTVAVRLAVPPDETGLEWLARVQRELVELRRHETASLAAVRGMADVPRPLELFDSLFLFENYRKDAPLETAGRSAGLVDVAWHEKIHYPLTALAIPGTRLLLRLIHHRDRFEAGAVDEMLAGWSCLLEALARDPRRRLAELPVVPPRRRRQVLVDWNDTEREIPERTVPDLVRARALVAPHAPAAAGPGAAVDAQGLVAGMIGVAAALTERGVRPGDLVGVYAERSVGMLAGLLGILHAGAAYLPLDPAYPSERLAFMLSDSGCRLVLTTGPLADSLPGRATARVLLEEARPAADPAAAGPTAGASSFEGRAYVIYTSGSTGRPKGVAVSHRSLTNFVLSMCESPGFGRDDLLLAVTPVSFDIAALELFGPLVAGARVEICPSAVAADGRALAERLDAGGVTCMQATPATWRLLIEAGWRGRPGFRALCGGEALPGDLAFALLERCAEVVNLYGPTETTIWSALHRVERGDRPVPIGRPIANTKMYVLDPGGQPVPVGAAGELLIGGAGVAEGYVGRPELTAERFAEDPFVPGGRVYRTGDRARWRADGRLEFLGRLDRQIKLRGFRIEPGEVEAALERHPEVERAVVQRSGQAGDERLVAWLQPRGAALPGDDVLREHLSASLPAYMIPGAFTPVTAWPRTPAGKLDVEALPEPGRRERVAEPAGPQTPEESRLARMFEELLGVTPVGREDDFFSLGGHSLLAMRLVQRVEKDLGRRVALSELLRHATVAALARVVARAAPVSPASGEPPAVVAHPAEADQPFPLADIQEAYWVGRSGGFALGGVSTHSYLEVDGHGVDVDRVESALRRLVERHGMLRAVVLPEGVQRILPEVPSYRIEVDDLSGLEDEAAERALLATRGRMSHQVLPADRWPLFEVRASRLAGGRVRFHVGFDALVLDAWSGQLLLSEWEALFRDPEAELPRLELSFRDYVLASRAAREGPDYRRARDYWQRREGDLPAAPDLPRVREPGAIDRPEFTRDTWRLDADAWSALRSEAGRGQTTPAGLLLAAYASVLSAWAREPRFTLNLTTFDRRPVHPDVNRILGDFTTLTLVAVDTASPATFAELARGVQERLFADLDHRDYSGVEVLRDLARRGERSAVAAMPVVFTSVLGMEMPAGFGVAFLGDLVYAVNQTPQVFLDLQVFEEDGGLACAWTSIPALFPPGMVEAMARAYEALLLRLARDSGAWQRSPGRIVREAAPSPQRIDPPEHEVRHAPRERLHEAFWVRAAEKPDAPAVVCGDRVLSYAEVGSRASALAATIRRRGVGPGELVALVTERGWEEAVAMLAACASGAAYLPVDASMPAPRLHQLLADGAVRLALTQERLAETVRWPAGVRHAVIDAAEAAPEAAPAPASGPEDVAYVIYTSGSTGHPKGVMIEHAAAWNTVADINRRFGVSGADRVLGLSAPSFDLSVWDVFGVLAAGGTLVVPTGLELRDPAAWQRLMVRHGVTVWNSVPALMQLLVDRLEGVGERLPESLRLVMLSGDWIPLSLPARIRALGADVEVVSLGGATEASIWSIFHRIERVDPAWTSIPYGRALAGQSVAVLDASLEPRPVGCAGPIYIGGVGLARGYWRNPERTDHSFVRHPATGQRLYRTGDLGRCLPGGEIELLGREDLQVKVRGYRVELGEIEARLSSHAEISEAAVVARGDRFDERVLVGFVVPVAGRSPAPETLRAFLASGLPDYMVPAAIQVLPALPLGANGKVDRRALASVDPGVVAAEGVGEAPHDLVERVAALVGEVMGRTVGPDEDLLSLGASSVTLIRIANLVERELGVRPHIGDLYAEPTATALAGAVTRERTPGESLAGAQEIEEGEVP